jgi:(+)-trans-carveol dehydrogenase
MSEKKLEGRTVVITGGARGQGRSHAVIMAESGANVVVCDLLEDVPSIPYHLSREEDMDETVRLVKEVGGEIVWRKADVRSSEDMAAVADLAMETFGRIDILLANAGVLELGSFTHELPDDHWQNMIDINLTGVWKSCKAVVPHMIESGNGGAIVITSSTDGLMPAPGWGHYSTAKHGLQGLMKTLAFELSPHGIRVNTVNPTGVDTKMVEGNTMTLLEDVVLKQWPKVSRQNLMEDVWLIEPADVSRAILYLVSDDARFVTGISLPVDAGYLLKV